VHLNEIWAFNLSSLSWSFIAGDRSTSNNYNYGQLGIASASNLMTRRAQFGGAFVAQLNSIFFFGGYGQASNGFGPINDLWLLNMTSNQFVWLGGSQRTWNVTSIYGTQGQFGPATWPGSKERYMMEYNPQTNVLILFGGSHSNEMWYYNLTSGWWAFQGKDTYDRHRLNMGALGPPNEKETIPPRIRHAIAYSTRQNKMMVFGGQASFMHVDGLNDQWIFDMSTRQFTFTSGGTNFNQDATYGARGVQASNIRPSIITNASPIYLDIEDAVLLIGGQCKRIVGGVVEGPIIEMWLYNFTSSWWTFVSGPTALNTRASYGIQNVARDTNIPGSLARHGVVYNDRSQLAYIFGGDGWTNTTRGLLNSVWLLNLTRPLNFTTNLTWTWLSGQPIADPAGTYGQR
jgi:hypothetical protein